MTPHDSALAADGTGTYIERLREKGKDFLLQWVIMTIDDEKILCREEKNSLLR